MATTGNNGDNETNIGFSKLISYSIYDENKTEINVNNLSKNITDWIPKEVSAFNLNPYKYIRAINISNPFPVLNQSSLNETNMTSSYFYADGFIVNGLNLNTTNVSLHIQLKPVNISNSIAYLFLLKFGPNPEVKTDRTLDFDEWRFFCSKGKKYFYLKIKLE